MPLLEAAFLVLPWLPGADAHALGCAGRALQGAVHGADGDAFWRGALARLGRDATSPEPRARCRAVALVLQALRAARSTPAARDMERAVRGGGGQLFLRHRGLGPVGARLLADVLRVSPHICELYAAANNFRDAGARELAAAVAEHPRLRLLDLHQNTLGDEAAFALAAAARANPALEWLNLLANPIGHPGADALHAVAAERPALHVKLPDPDQKLETQLLQTWGGAWP